MATVPIIKCTSKEQLAGMRLIDEKNGEKSEKALGKTIGAGSYATVKVIYHILSFLFFSFPSSFILFFNSKHLLRVSRRSQSPIDMTAK